jgi:hypothetical protein
MGMCSMYWVIEIALGDRVPGDGDSVKHLMD